MRKKWFKNWFYLAYKRRSGIYTCIPTNLSDISLYKSNLSEIEVFLREAYDSI